MRPITIALADDHQVVRLGLRALLEAEPNFAVVGEAADGPEALGLVERLEPDVLVLDLMMPGLGGLEVARRLREQVPRTRVVMLSMYANEPYVFEALRNGASGYVLKSASGTELVASVRAVMAGRRYLSPPLSERGIEAYAKRVAESALDLYQTLTSREREVLHLGAEGYSAPEIAARLRIGARTVETHRANLMRKLRLASQSDLIRYAIRRGILAVEPDPQESREVPRKRPARA